MAIINSIYNSEDLTKLPSIKEAVNEILKSTTPKDWHKPCFAVILMTGARVGEVLQLRKKDFTFFNDNGNPIEPLDSGTNIYKMVINLITEKKRIDKKVFRKVPILFVRNNQQPTELAPLLPLVLGHLKTLTNPDDKVFPKSRHTVLWALKKYVDPEYYSHLFRHIQATNDALGGMNEFAMVKKFGWRDLRPATNYVSLLAKDIEREQQRVYDKRSIAGDDIVVPNKVIEEKEQSIPINHVSSIVVDKKKVVEIVF